MRFCLALIVLTAGCTDGGDETDFDGDGVTAATDCDDGNANVFPGNTEVCDGVDNDCSGAADDEAVDTLTWYVDDDSDGYGDPASTVFSCTQPAGAIDNSDDCDDTDWLVNPEATEVCDLLDNDCNGVIDDAADGDGDGIGECDDCNDADATIYKGATEYCDDIDNDCDSEIDEFADDFQTWYADNDGDEHGDAADSFSGCDQPDDYVLLDDDCNDADETIYTDAPELCDTLDNDCDTIADEGTDVDVDGYDTVCGDDCDDDNADVNPGQTEVCDGIDNNCSGTADDEAEDAAWYYADSDSDGFGDAGTGQIACEQPTDYVLDDTDCNDGDGSINPDATEVCDDVDQDCDEGIDEGLFSTYYADGDGDGYGDADSPSEFCADPGTGYATNDEDCDDGETSVNPGATEACDGSVDEDCDESVDEGLTTTYYADADGDGFGDPASSSEECSNPGSGYSTNDEDCDDDDPDISPDDAEICDGVDQDCDDLTDEGIATTTYYTDGDGDGYGEDGSGSDSCSDPGTGYVDIDGDCDDGDENVSPDEAEVCNDWVDNDCDGTDNGCTPTGTFSASDADVKIYAVSASGDGELGYSVFAGGDYTGDGVDDLLLGAPWDDVGGTQGGATYVFSDPLGSLTTSDADALLGPTGADDLAGRGGAIGDLDGDGTDDVAVGAYGANGVYIFSGAPGSAAPSADALIVHTGSVSFGIAVAIGDLDGDGQDDLAVGATTYDSTSLNDVGAVYIFYGPISGTLDETDADAVLEGTGGGNQAGGTLAFTGDVVGAGLDTLAIGARYNDDAGTDAGAVFLVTGSWAGTVSLSGADAVLTGAVADDNAWDAHAAGDVDGDGTDDLVVGAFKYDSASFSNAGGAFIVYGPVASGSLSGADLIITGEANGNGMGLALDGAGDFNGDGEADLITGAYGNDDASTDAGSAYVFFGPLSAHSDATTADLKITGETSSGQLGWSVAGNFDANDDGYSDVVACARKENSTATDGGACYVFFGGGL